MLAFIQPVQPLQATNHFGAAIAAVDLLSKVGGPAAGLWRQPLLAENSFDLLTGCVLASSVHSQLAVEE